MDSLLNFYTLSTFFRKNEEEVGLYKKSINVITMGFYARGFGVLLMLAGGALVGTGIAFAATPLLIGGVMAFFVSGLVFLFSRT